jgi:small subunit ribosomal protein S8e
MARSQRKSKRKASGGRYGSPNRAKIKCELAGFPMNTKLSTEDKRKSVRTVGGNLKQKTLTANLVSVADKKGKITKTEMTNVVDNPANQHLVRRNILTKGAVVETKLGKVKITSRPGQEGSVSGVLI